MYGLYCRAHRQLMNYEQQRWRYRLRGRCAPANAI
ncbi:hypothetical protein ACLB1E_00125 [Escherichia coli]